MLGLQNNELSSITSVQQSSNSLTIDYQLYIAALYPELTFDFNNAAALYGDTVFIPRYDKEMSLSSFEMATMERHADHPNENYSNCGRAYHFLKNYAGPIEMHYDDPVTFVSDKTYKRVIADRETGELLYGRIGFDMRIDKRYVKVADWNAWQAEPEATKAEYEAYMTRNTSGVTVTYKFYDAGGYLVGDNTGYPSYNDYDDNGYVGFHIPNIPAGAHSVEYTVFNKQAGRDNADIHRWQRYNLLPHFQ